MLKKRKGSVPFNKLEYIGRGISFKEPLPGGCISIENSTGLVSAESSEYDLTRSPLSTHVTFRIFSLLCENLYEISDILARWTLDRESLYPH